MTHDAAVSHHGAGGPVPPDPVVDPTDADPESIARAIVLQRLTRSPQTRHQLAQALARRRVPDEAAARVLDRMTEVGLVDDAAYAREYVRMRREARGLSRRALAVELARRGISDADAEEALASVAPDDDRAAARALVEHKWRSVQGLDAAAARRRLAGLLARRGYGPGIAFSVIREVEQERGGIGTAADDVSAADLIASGDEV